MACTLVLSRLIDALPAELLPSRMTEPTCPSARIFAWAAVSPPELMPTISNCPICSLRVREAASSAQLPTATLGRGTVAGTG